jgi:hypothetical protein
LEVIMSPIRERYLSLGEVETLIRKFEDKYGVSTTEFLKNPELRAQMIDDDVFQWEAFDAHRDELERIDAEVRGEYLQSVTQKPFGELCEPAANKNLALAA